MPPTQAHASDQYANSSAKHYGKIIVMKRNGQDSASFELTDANYLFGRAERCDIRIQLSSIGEEHCRIFPEPNGNFAMIQNLSSVGVSINGTVLNDHKEHQLTNNDIITIVERSFRYENAHWQPPTVDGREETGDARTPVKAKTPTKIVSRESLVKESPTRQRTPTFTAEAIHEVIDQLINHTPTKTASHADRTPVKDQMNVVPIGKDTPRLVMTGDADCTNAASAQTTIGTPNKAVNSPAKSFTITLSPHSHPPAVESPTKTGTVDQVFTITNDVSVQYSSPRSTSVARFSVSTTPKKTPSKTAAASATLPPPPPPPSVTPVSQTKDLGKILPASGHATTPTKQPVLQVTPQSERSRTTPGSSGYVALIASSSSGLLSSHVDSTRAALQKGGIIDGEISASPKLSPRIKMIAFDDALAHPSSSSPIQAKTADGVQAACIGQHAHDHTADSRMVGSIEEQLDLSPAQAVCASVKDDAGGERETEHAGTEKTGTLLEIEFTPIEACAEPKDAADVVMEGEDGANVACADQEGEGCANDVAMAEVDRAADARDADMEASNQGGNPCEQEPAHDVEMATTAVIDNLPHSGGKEEEEEEEEHECVNATVGLVEPPTAEQDDSDGPPHKQKEEMDVEMVTVGTHGTEDDSGEQVLVTSCAETAAAKSEGPQEAAGEAADRSQDEQEGMAQDGSAPAAAIAHTADDGRATVIIDGDDGGDGTIKATGREQQQQHEDGDDCGGQENAQGAAEPATHEQAAGKEGETNKDAVTVRIVIQTDGKEVEECRRQSNSSFPRAQRAVSESGEEDGERQQDSAQPCTQATRTSNGESMMATATEAPSTPRRSARLQRQQTPSKMTSCESKPSIARNKRSSTAAAHAETTDEGEREADDGPEQEQEEQEAASVQEQHPDSKTPSAASARRKSARTPKTATASAGRHERPQTAGAAARRPHRAPSDEAENSPSLQATRRGKAGSSDSNNNVGSTDDDGCDENLDENMAAKRQTRTAVKRALDAVIASEPDPPTAVRKSVRTRSK